MESIKNYDDFADHTCFVITPLGASDSETRKKAEEVIKAFIQPIVEDKFSMKMTLPHEISETGNINDQIIKHLLYDDLVIANLTEANSNVMYELGIRHAVKKHVVQIAEESTKLPFDIKPERTIFYKHDLSGFSEFKKQLIDAILENLSQPEKNINNPVYRVHDNVVLKDYIDSHNADIAGVLKETNDNVRRILSLNDFKDFTYKNTHEGVVYQAGLELEFKCQFGRVDDNPIAESDLHTIERFLESGNKLSNHLGGHGLLSSDKDKNIIECLVRSDKPINLGLVNQELERKQLPYRAILTEFNGPAVRTHSGYSGSNSSNNS